MILKRIAIKLINKLPYVRGLYQENLDLKMNSCFLQGHYYSPIISIDNIKEREDNIWNKSETDGIASISLNTQSQIELIKNSLSKFYNEMPLSQIDKKMSDTILRTIFIHMRMELFCIQ